MKPFSFLLLLIVLTTTLFAGTNTLKRVEVKKNELRLVFSSWLNTKDVRRIALKNPPRQVIDIKNARLGSRSIASGLSAKGVNSFRVSQYQKNVVRIVIETDESYVCNHYQPMMSRSFYHIPLPQKNVYMASEAESEAMAYAKKEARKIEKQPQERRKTQRVIQREEKIQEEVSYIPSFLASGSRGPKKSYTIVVDAGHGGHDSGAVGARRYQEKVVVLQIAKRVEKHLKKKRFKVKMTRSSDKFIKLKNRTKFANKHQADIFVSIHANAIADKRRFNKVSGIETYFLQTTRSARSKRIAAIENSVVLDKNDFLSKDVILNAVLSGPKIQLSHKLAIDVQSKMLRNVRKKYKNVKDAGVRPAPFWVLVGAQMPSILVEVGYITNSAERARLFTPAYQDRIAKGIAEGISNYLAIREKEIY
ncbi:MAG: N-acetylmuramoyl-L-alanine amidase [Campylobacterota bacterium]|nr:N-acetylmuramoyl-L-alanine amidase [Campylobacterota bacterium]